MEGRSPRAFAEAAKRLYVAPAGPAAAAAARPVKPLPAPLGAGRCGSGMAQSAGNGGRTVAAGCGAGVVVGRVLVLVSDDVAEAGSKAPGVGGAPTVLEA